MKIIVGLGNPGLRYGRTRHNVGARAARYFAESHKIGLRYRKYRSLFGEGRAGGEDVKVVLPMTYMNLSGQAVAGVKKDLNVDFSEMLVLCDDADLPFGAIRIRGNGSAGGHRGLKSIIESLGSKEFPRLRIGIGRAEEANDPGLKDYVLGPFNKEEEKALERILARIGEAADCWIKKGINAVMNLYNG